MCLVPGIGKMSSPCASTQASASLAWSATLGGGQLLDLLHQRQIVLKILSWNRGELRR